MLQARYKYGAAVLRGSIYVAGGKSDIDKNLSSVECYHPETANWTQIAEMNHPRDDFALVAMTDCLYALGYDRTVERYDLKSNSWTVVSHLLIFNLLEEQNVHVDPSHVFVVGCADWTFRWQRKNFTCCWRVH